MHKCELYYELYENYSIFCLICLQAYLMIGYYFTMMDSYTIKWTTPHCVLTLRLIGLVFDVYDGRKQKVSRKKGFQFTTDIFSSFNIKN